MKGFVENPHVHDLVPESVKKIFITVSFFILQKKRKTEKKKKIFIPFHRQITYVNIKCVAFCSVPNRK
jgi:hypothetical protein